MSKPTKKLKTAINPEEATSNQHPTHGGFFTPQQFAKAVFPSPILGREISSDTGVDLKASHQDCIDTILPELEKYNYSPFIYRTTNILQQLKKDIAGFAPGHGRNPSGRTNLVYCYNCHVNKPDQNEWSASIIAVMRWDDEEARKHDTAGEGDGKKKQIKRAHFTVTHIFPHSAQCMVPYQFRRNFNMDLQNHGCGYDKFQFPTEIVDAVCQPIVDKLQLTGMKDDHKGLYL